MFLHSIFLLLGSMRTGGGCFLTQISMAGLKAEGSCTTLPFMAFVFMRPELPNTAMKEEEARVERPWTLVVGPLLTAAPRGFPPRPTHLSLLPISGKPFESPLGHSFPWVVRRLEGQCS